MHIFCGPPKSQKKNVIVRAPHSGCWKTNKTRHFDLRDTLDLQDPSLSDLSDLKAPSKRQSTGFRVRKDCKILSGYNFFLGSPIFWGIQFLRDTIQSLADPGGVCTPKTSHSLLVVVFRKTSQSFSPEGGGGHFGWTPWERGPLLLKRCPSNFLEDTRNLANTYPWLASMVLGYPGQNLIRVIKVIRISGVSKTIVDWAKKNGIGKERFSVIQPLKRVNLPNTMIKKNMACI